MPPGTTHQAPSTKHEEPRSSESDGEVLVKVEGVSKIFCRDFKKSLLYGLQDSARDLVSWGRLKAPGTRHGDAVAHQAPSTKHQEQSTRALREGEFLAVNNVSFELRRGECLGLIGHNGAGKTTLLKMLNGLIKPDAGRIEMRGRVGALIALGAGFNPLLTGRENIYINGSVLGMSKKDIDEKIEEIIDFAEIGKFIDAPVQTYSSGMQVRLGFAVATAMEPDILIADEVLAVGDANFKVKCYNKIRSILPRTSIMIVSHNLFDIIKVCSTALVLENGGCAYLGEVGKGVSEYNNLSDSNFENGGLVYTADESIDNVEMVSLEAESHSAFSSIRGVLRISVTKDIANVRCRFVFFDRQEMPVAEWDSEDYSERYFFSKGVNVHRIEINHVRLIAGSYRFVVVLTDANDNGYHLRVDRGIRVNLGGRFSGGAPYRI